MKTARFFAIVVMIMTALFSANCNAERNYSDNVSTYRDNDSIVTQQRNVGDFTGVSVHIVGNVNIIVGKPCELTVSASSKDIDNIKTYVANGCLVIEYENPNKKWFKNKSDNNLNINIDVYVESLKAVTATGCANVKIPDAVSGYELNVIVSGASVIQFANVDINGRINAEVSGASTLNISGSATNVTYKASGASNINAYDLNCIVAQTDASGASTIKASADQELKAYASGASTIKYLGHPKVLDIQTSGASNVKGE